MTERGSAFPAMPTMQAGGCATTRARCRWAMSISWSTDKTPRGTRRHPSTRACETAASANTRVMSYAHCAVAGGVGTFAPCRRRRAAARGGLTNSLAAPKSSHLRSPKSTSAVLPTARHLRVKPFPQDGDRRHDTGAAPDAGPAKVDRRGGPGQAGRCGSARRRRRSTAATGRGGQAPVQPRAGSIQRCAVGVRRQRAHPAERAVCVRHAANRWSSTSASECRTTTSKRAATPTTPRARW